MTFIDADPSPDHESATVRQLTVLDIGWARTGRGLVCGNCH